MTGRKKGGVRKKGSSDEELQGFCPCGETKDGYWICCDNCDTWLHGDCVDLTEKQTRSFDKYYCPKCVAKTPTLQSTLKTTTTTSKKTTTLPESTITAGASTARTPKVSIKRRKQAAAVAEGQPGPSKLVPSQAPVVKDKKSTGSVKSDVKSTVVPAKVAAAIKKKKAEGVFFGKKRVNPRLSNTTDQVQCHGPGCVKSSRRGSKYCSHECGLEQAKRRLLLILPTKVEDYCGELPDHVKLTAAELQQITDEMNDLKQKLDNLSETKSFFMKYVDELITYNDEMAKDALISVPGYGTSELIKEENPDQGLDFIAHCGMCGSVSHNSYHQFQKHIARCFSRLEKRTAFTGPFQQIDNPENIICDQFCKQQNGFCKRIRVLCIDHYKGILTEKRELCGAPLAFFLPTFMVDPSEPLEDWKVLSEGICGHKRGECELHFNWDKMLLGVLDSCRLSYCKRLEEITGDLVAQTCFVQQRIDVTMLLQNCRLTEDRDEFGMPLDVDFVNNLPAAVEQKFDWTDEVAKINGKLQKKLEERFQASEKKKAEEKAAKEAAKKVRAKRKKKAGPPAKRVKKPAGTPKGKGAKAEGPAAEDPAAEENAEPCANDDNEFVLPVEPVV